MIKALFLIFKPVIGWDLIVQARRRLGFILTFYLLPMVLTVAVVEGFGLAAWGKPQTNLHHLHKFKMGEVVIYEVVQSLLALLVVAVCAWVIKMFAETFHRRNTYQQTFTLAVYGLGPMFLFRLLDVLPGLNPWITWGIGIMLSVEVIYQGIPKVLEPDPPSAFGLYVISSVALIAITGIARFITAWYLSGHFRPLEDFVSQVAAKFPF